jgi:hypothetical protein
MKQLLFKRKDRDVPDFEDDGKDMIAVIEEMNRLNEQPVAPWNGREGADWAPPPPFPHPQQLQRQSGPQPRLMLPPPPRPSLGRLLRAWKATLPMFRAAARVAGHRGFLPVPPLLNDEGNPMMGFEQAIYAIALYCDKTDSMTRSRYQAARAELAEMKRDYEARERELRSRRPLPTI